MFERVMKTDVGSESSDTSRPESDKTFGALRSKASSRNNEVAVIGSSIQINGDLRGDEDLRIEGNVTGTVELKNSVLTIGKEGRVTAGVYAKSIAVDGETKGDLYATERVSVHVNARVQGNIIAPKVSIEEGAHFKGSIEMDPAAVEKALGKTTTNIADNLVASTKTDSAAGNRATRKKTGKDADTKVIPPAKSA
ncbi:MAG: polymer-forming cytoskeletal protein [Gammaproteobacteria bacterium]|nr:polymer-forming cytoskeletal protein [Gammaproteobacteria bacterium]